MNKSKIQSRLKLLVSQYKDILINYPHPDASITNQKTFLDYCESRIDDLYSVTFKNLESEILKKLQDYVNQNTDIVSQYLLEIEKRRKRINDLELELENKTREIRSLNSQLNETSLPLNVVEAVNAAISNIDEVLHLLSGSNPDNEGVRPNSGLKKEKPSLIRGTLEMADAMEMIRGANLTERDLKICIAYFSGVDQSNLAASMNVGKASLYVYERALQKNLGIKSIEVFRAFFSQKVDIEELNEMLRACKKKKEEKRAARPPSSSRPSSEKATLQPRQLSKREEEIFNLLKIGKVTIEIADALFICEKSVKFHLTRMYRKLNIKSRSEFLARHGVSPSYASSDLLKFKDQFLRLRDLQKTILRHTLLGSDAVAISQKVEMSSGRIKHLVSELCDLFGVYGKYELILKLKGLPYDDWEKNPHQIESKSQDASDPEKQSESFSLPAPKVRLSNAINYRPEQQTKKTKPTEEVLLDVTPDLPFGIVHVNRKAS